MARIENGDVSRKAELGDVVQLKNQEQEVVACEQTGVLMLNIDADQLAQGDLTFIKKLGLTISNPDTDRPIALGVDYTEDSFGSRLASFFSSDDSDDDEESSSSDDDDDDSSFFSSGSFGGSSSFGGFGGGGFSGGGASAGF